MKKLIFLITLYTAILNAGGIKTDTIQLGTNGPITNWSAIITETDPVFTATNGWLVKTNDAVYTNTVGLANSALQKEADTNALFQLTVHTTNQLNPHAVTPAQIGAATGSPLYAFTEADPAYATGGVQLVGGTMTGPLTNEHGFYAASLSFTNAIELRAGALDGTNGVYFFNPVTQTNYWILFP